MNAVKSPLISSLSQTRQSQIVNQRSPINIRQSSIGNQPSSLVNRRFPLSGASLLFTLVTVAGIVILFVVLARVVMVEKRVSRGYSEILRAEIAAQAGVEDAGNLLLELFRDYPDSATYWEPKMGDTDTPGTVFMYQNRSKISGKNVLNMSNATAPEIWARPLISGAESRRVFNPPTGPFDESGWNTTLPKTKTEAANSIDINQPNTFDGGDPTGWVGALPGATPTPIRVPWVEVLADPTAARSAANPVVARYAWWAEDESFKLNVNVAKAALRGNPASEFNPTSGKSTARPTLQGMAAISALSQAASEIEETRAGLTITGGRFLSSTQLMDTPSVRDLDQSEADKFRKDTKFLLTAESSGLNLSRSGAKRLNLNAVLGWSLNDIPNDATGRPALSHPEAPGQIKTAVRQIEEAIKINAPDFGQRFFRLQNTDSILVPTGAIPLASAANKNRFDVPATAPYPSYPSLSYRELYIRKLAVNIYDYLSPAVNPTVMDHDGDVLLGEPLYPSDIFEDMGPIEKGAFNSEDNPFAAIGKKRVPYFTEYMINGKILSRVPKPGGNSTIGYAEYEIEIDHYFEFWNMTDTDIVPANGDLGPKPYLVLENQPAISVNNKGKHPSPPNQEVPLGRPFEIKLDEKFSLNGGPDSDLIFPAGSVAVITTDPNYASRNLITGLAGKTVWVAKALYAPGTNTRCDNAGFSTQPFPAGEGSANAIMHNVRRYQLASYNTDSGNEIQFGPDMEGTTTIKLVVGNGYGILEMHPSLSVGAQTQNSMVFRPNTNQQQDRFDQYRGSFVGSAGTQQAGFYDPRSSLEAIEIYLVNNQEIATDHVTNASSMAILNGQKDAPKENHIKMGQSHLGDIAKADFTAAASNSRGTGTLLWNTDRITSLQGALHAPMVVAQGPMKNIGELGHIFDPLRFGSNQINTIKRRRAGGRTITIGQPDYAWDGSRNQQQSGAEFQYQTSASRSWTAWRLADIFTVKADDDMAGDDANPSNQTEVSGLYNPNGILRDGGRVLRTLVEGLRHPTGSASHTALAGTLFNADKTDNLPVNITSVQQQNTAQPGGQALATYLAQRLTRANAQRFSPIWEPGEISQLFLFDIASTNPQLASGVQLVNVNDRGREEITRRLMDLITPKGNTYSIYVVGQSVLQDKNDANKITVLGTKAQRVTVRLRPVFDPPLENSLDENFDPDSEVSVNDRFRMPNAWNLEVLGVEDAS